MVRNVLKLLFIAMSTGYFVSIVAGLWPALARSVVLLNSAGHYIPGYSSVPPSKVRNHKRIME